MTEDLLIAGISSSVERNLAEALAIPEDLRDRPRLDRTIRPTVDEVSPADSAAAV
jgi:hypothetical protein